MKIVILDGYTENPGDLSWNGFEALGEVTVYDRTNEDQIAERIGRAEAVLTNKTPITAGTMEECRNLKYIGVLATGYNVVDITAAKQKGITVTNVPAYSTDSVAQHTMALILELSNHVGAHQDSVQEGEWVRSRDFCYWKHPIIELAGKTLGIVGYGSIGRRTAEVAEAFGMNILVASGHLPLGDRPGELPGRTVRVVELEELLRCSDFISLHCPLTEKNKYMINRDTLKMMKKSAYLVNTARGPLICESDLRKAVLNGTIAGAAVDVAEIEPMKEDSPLLGVENILVTPHIAWASKEARGRLMETAVDNLKQYMAGTPVHVVSR